MSFKKATPEETKAWLGGGQIHFGNAMRPPSNQSSQGSLEKLPNTPVREGFKTQEEFEEAMGSWQENAGRIKAMAARALKDSPSE